MGWKPWERVIGVLCAFCLASSGDRAAEGMNSICWVVDAPPVDTIIGVGGESAATTLGPRILAMIDFTVCHGWIICEPNDCDEVSLRLLLADLPDCGRLLLLLSTRKELVVLLPDPIRDEGVELLLLLLLLESE